MQPMAAIVLVMALLGGALFLMRKRGAVMFPNAFKGTAGGSRQLEVIERLSLGPQHTVHLVRVGGRCVLIATAPGNCQIHSQIPEGIPELR